MDRVRPVVAFVGGFVLFMVEEVTELVDVVTGREAKFRRYQAEQRARLNEDNY